MKAVLHRGRRCLIMSRGYPVALTEQRTLDNAVQKRYGFQFVQELEGHCYSVQCAQVRINPWADSSKSKNCGDGQADDGGHCDGSSSASGGNDFVPWDEESQPLYKKGVCQVVSVDSRSVRLWDVFRQRKRLVFPFGKTSFLRTILFIPEKSVYVAASVDMCLKFYDLQLECVSSMRIEQRAVYKLNYNSLTGELITAGIDGVTLWSWHEWRSEEWDRRSKLWRLVTRYDIKPRKLLEESQWAQGVEVDSTNELLHVLCNDSVIVYSATTGHVTDRLMHIHSQTVTDSLFYASSHYYVTSCNAGEIKVWSCARNNSLVHAFRCHSKAVTKLALHPAEHGSDLLISCSMDSTVRMLDLEALTELYCLTLSRPCSGMQILADPKLERESGAAAHILLSTETTMQLWKLNHLTRPFLPYRSKVNHLETFHAAKSAKASKSGKLRGNELLSTKKGLALRGIHLAPPDKEKNKRDNYGLVLLGSCDGTIRLVDPKSGDLVSRIVPGSDGETVIGLSYSPSLNVIFTLQANGEIHVFETNTDPANIVERWEHTCMPKNQVCAMTLSLSDVSVPNRMPARNTKLGIGVKLGSISARPSMIASDGAGVDQPTNRKQSISFHQMHLQQQQQEQHEQHQQGQERTKPLQNNPRLMRRGALAGSEYIIGGTVHGSLFFWDARNEGTVQACVPRAHDAQIQDIKYHGNESSNQRLVSCSVRGEIKVWNLRNLSVLATFPPPSNSASVSCLGISPATSLLFSGHNNGECAVYDLARLEHVQRAFSSAELNHTKAITAAIFIDILRLLVTTGLDGAVKVWDIDQNLVRELDIHGEPVYAMTMLDNCDLLIGEGERVVSIPAHKLLPPHYQKLLKALVARKIEDAKWVGTTISKLRKSASMASFDIESSSDEDDSDSDEDEKHMDILRRLSKQPHEPENTRSERTQSHGITSNKLCHLHQGKKQLGASNDASSIADRGGDTNEDPESGITMDAELFDKFSDKARNKLRILAKNITSVGLQDLDGPVIYGPEHVQQREQQEIANAVAREVLKEACRMQNPDRERPASCNQNQDKEKCHSQQTVEPNMTPAGDLTLGASSAIVLKTTKERRNYSTASDAVASGIQAAKLRAQDLSDAAARSDSFTPTWSKNRPRSPLRAELQSALNANMTPRNLKRLLKVSAVSKACPTPNLTPNSSMSSIGSWASFSTAPKSGPVPKSMATKSLSSHRFHSGPGPFSVSVKPRVMAKGKLARPPSLRAKKMTY